MTSPIQTNDPMRPPRPRREERLAAAVGQQTASGTETDETKANPAIEEKFLPASPPKGILRSATPSEAQSNSTKRSDKKIRLAPLSSAYSHGYAKIPEKDDTVLINDDKETIPTKPENRTQLQKKFIPLTERLELISQKPFPNTQYASRITARLKELEIATRSQASPQKRKAPLPPGTNENPIVIEKTVPAPKPERSGSGDRQSTIYEDGLRPIPFDELNRIPVGSLLTIGKTGGGDRVVINAQLPAPARWNKITTFLKNLRRQR